MPVGTIPRREHLVAAALVGTVVVVVGFASGLGLTHPAGAGTPSEPPTTAQPPPAQPPPAQAAAPGDQSQAGGGGGGSGPVDYVGTPAGVVGNPVVPAATDVPTPSTPPVTGPTAAPPTSTPPTSTTSQPQPVCQPGLVTGVLNQVTSIVDGLPVVGSLTPQLTDPLLGTCSSSTVDGSTAQTTAPGLLPLLLPNGGGS